MADTTLDLVQAALTAYNATPSSDTAEALATATQALVDAYRHLVTKEANNTMSLGVLEREVRARTGTTGRPIRAADIPLPRSG